MKKLGLALFPLFALLAIGLFSSQGRQAGSFTPSGTINICDYGAGPQKSAATNTTAFGLAVAAVAAGGRLFVSPGTYQVNAITWGSVNYTLQLDGILSLNAADTIPANVTVKVGQGGGFTRVAGDHLTINGQFSAGMHKVFTEATATNDWVVFGSGFTGSAIPQWWGAVGNGVADDTDAMNKMTASGVRKMWVPDGTYMIDTVSTALWADAGVIMQSNQMLELSDGATLQAIACDDPYQMVVFIDGKSNVIIKGGNIVGERDAHVFAGGGTHEWGHGILCLASTNVKISCVSISACAGDGIYVGYTTGPYVASENVVIESCIIDGSRRDNVSICGAQHVSVTGCEITNAGATLGTAPKCGVNVEAYAGTSTAIDVVVDKCHFTGNVTQSVSMSGCESVVVRDCYSDNMINCGDGYNVYVEGNTIISGTPGAGYGVNVAGPFAGGGRTENLVSISGNKLIGWLQFITLSSSVGVHISGNYIVGTATVTSTAVEGFDINNSSRITISGNTIESIVASGSTGSVYGLVAYGTSDDLLVSANRFYNIARGSAVRFSGSGICRVSGNDFSYNIRAMDIAGGSCAFVGNHVDEDSFAVLTNATVRISAGTTATICGNTFKNCTYYVIHNSGTGALSVTGNLIDNYKDGTAIYSSAGAPQVVGNTVIKNSANAGTVAIYFAGTTGGRVIGNSILSINTGNFTNAINTDGAGSTASIVQENYCYSGTIVSDATDTVRNNSLSAQYPAQANPVLIGTVSASGDSYIYIAKQSVTIERIDLVSSTGIASDGTDYWTAQIANLTHAGNLLATAKSTNGAAVTADVIWSITPDQNATLVTGDVLEIQLTKAASAPDWTRLMVVVHARNTQ